MHIIKDSCNPVEKKSAGLISPLVTFALFAYNQDKYVCEAIKGALGQTYSPLEIILSDDCSTDSTFDLIRQVAEHYSGPHFVQVIRNKQNLGVCAHVNEIIATSCGELIVVSAGDDISAPDRVKELVAVWRETGASAVYSNAEMIDETGKCVGQWKIVDFPLRETVKIRRPSDVAVPRFYGAGAAYDRRLFTFLGPLPTDVRNEDYNLAWRAVLANGIAYSPTTLLKYRKHEDNLSYWSKISRADTFQERVENRIRMFDNEIKNLKHIAGYATEKFGASSPIVNKIEKIVFDLKKKKRKPNRYEILFLLKDFWGQFGLIRWFVSKLRTNGKWVFLKSK